MVDISIGPSYQIMLIADQGADQCSINGTAR